MKDRKERVWVQQEDGTYFEIRRRGEVSVQRFDHFVTKLPEGARVVPAPPMINHSPEDLIKLKAMRDQYAATFQDVQTPARTMVFNILDHPTLSFKEKGKKLLALRKQFKMDDISNVQKQKLIGRNANSDAVDKQGRVPLATTTSLPLRPEEPAPLKEHEEELLRIGRSWVQGLLNGAQKMQLQANECSRLHKLIEQVKMVVAEPIHTFVVKHDWLAAFGSSLEGDDGPIMLPFPISAFEFKISGRLIIIIYEAEGSPLAFLELNGRWVKIFSSSGTPNALFKYIDDQVRAIAIMLDSEIAEYKTVTQPPALQKKRIASGKIPLSDYHVIDLSVRHRAGSKTAAPGTTGIKQRCHFRRGHWLHADERPKIEAGRHQIAQRWQEHDGHWRTWVNWCLAGDPDLGFVNQEYRL